MKRLYGLTNKKNAVQQIGAKYSRKEALHPAERQEIQDASKHSLEEHRQISNSRNTPINIYSFLLVNPGDPAKKVSAFPRLDFYFP